MKKNQFKAIMAALVACLMVCAGFTANAQEGWSVPAPRGWEKSPSLYKFLPFACDTLAKQKANGSNIFYVPAESAPNGEAGICVFLGLSCDGSPFNEGAVKATSFWKDLESWASKPCPDPTVDDGGTPPPPPPPPAPEPARHDVDLTIVNDDGDTSRIFGDASSEAVLIEAVRQAGPALQRCCNQQQEAEPEPEAPAPAPAPQPEQQDSTTETVLDRIGGQFGYQLGNEGSVNASVVYRHQFRGIPKLTETIA